MKYCCLGLTIEWRTFRNICTKWLFVTARSGLHKTSCIFLGSLACLPPEVNLVLEARVSYHFLIVSNSFCCKCETHFMQGFYWNFAPRQLAIYRSLAFRVSCLYVYDHTAPLAWKQLAVRPGGRVFSTAAWHFRCMQVKVSVDQLGRSAWEFQYIHMLLFIINILKIKTKYFPQSTYLSPQSISKDLII